MARVEKYSWDFETTTDPNDCRVWAWAEIPLSDPESGEVGTSIDSFIEHVSKHNTSGTFHNLKFDGEFIISWLLKHDYKVGFDKKRLHPKQFYTLISDKGQFYQIIIRWENGNRCEIKDSYKLLPFKVEQIAKDFGLPIRKLSIDYTAAREVGHELTDQEREYVLVDARIVALALNEMYKRKLGRTTIGSNALAEYKGMAGKSFRYWFPVPSNDAYIRRSYKGGFTYCNPRYAGMDIGKGIVLDVNSLYPSVMYNPKNLYPVGDGIYYDGKYTDDELHPLYFQRLICQFKLKKGYLPTIQVKNSFSRFIPTEYLTSSQGEAVELTLTSVDLALFLDHYDVYDIVWVDGFKYSAKSELFTDYIVYWTEQKVNAKHNGNKALYTIAKLMLNNLYGKFSTNPKGGGKYPVLEGGVVKYKPTEKDDREPVYIPVGSFVTAYARNVTIRSAQKVYDRFLYADTDSLHLIGTSLPEGLDIDDYRLGAWKHESTFAQARFLRSKTYMENEIVSKPGEKLKTEWKITCAGMPESCYSQVTFDNFRLGAKYDGKLMPKHVNGGIVLAPTTFQIIG